MFWWSTGSPTPPENGSHYESDKGIRSRTANRLIGMFTLGDINDESGSYQENLGNESDRIFE